MASRASIAGHPIHPMLVPIPIGLFLFSLAADFAVRFGWGDPWPAVALFSMGGGIAGALVAAVFGLIDLLSLSDPRARRIGYAHMAVNLAVVGLYLWNFALRLRDFPLESGPFLLSVIAVLLLIVSGWLGGHMVYVHGVGVTAGERLQVERRRTRVPVPRDRRRIEAGRPLSQH